jgi:hypothetical protein
MEDEGNEEPPAPGTEEDTPLKPAAQATVVTSQVINALGILDGYGDWKMINIVFYFIRLCLTRAISN